MGSGWRRIVISQSARLSLSDNCLIIQQEETSRIPIEQIESLIIESQQVSLSSALMVELVANDVSVIFCDQKHSPMFEAVPFQSTTYFPKNIELQIGWDEDRKIKIWTTVLQEKICHQAMLLDQLGMAKSEELFEIAKNMTEQNAAESEAQAARIYFRALFGSQFRRRTDNDINAMLNYGYSIILSSVNRSVVQHGYLTALGIGHYGCKNPYNLSCDIMEPFRPHVDRYVWEHKERKFDSGIRKELIALPLQEIAFKGKQVSLGTAIDMSTIEIISQLNQGGISCY